MDQGWALGLLRWLGHLEGYARQLVAGEQQVDGVGAVAAQLQAAELDDDVEEAEERRAEMQKRMDDMRRDMDRRMDELRKRTSRLP